MNEDMIALALEHFDVFQQLVAHCCRTPGIYEHLYDGLSLAEFQSLRDVIGVTQNHYLQLLSDRDCLLMLDGICYDALKGKEEEVDEVTRELEVTMDLLESTQSSLRELQT